MKIEHFAYQIENVAESAQWYCDNLGFTVKRGSDHPVPVRFLADESGEVMLEVYNNPAIKTPDYASMDPLLLHIAFVCDDVPAAVARLTAAGATIESEPEQIPTGDTIAMLRDPWGLAIQMCKRAEPMI